MYHRLLVQLGFDTVSHMSSMMIGYARVSTQDHMVVTCPYIKCRPCTSVNWERCAKSPPTR